MCKNSCVDLLLVEDNPDDLELATRALKKIDAGHRVHIARDGEEALQYIYRKDTSADRLVGDNLKVVLLDIKLPKVDGLEVVRRLKADVRTRAIPVVILTSSREQSDLMESYQMGVNSYIVKPVDFESFLAAMQQLGMYWLDLNQLPGSTS